VTLPSPAHFARCFLPGVSDRAYAGPSELTRDLAEILAGEAASLARAGVGHVQVDSPTYSAWLGADLAGGAGGPGGATQSGGWPRPSPPTTPSSTPPAPAAPSPPSTSVVAMPAAPG
jgi:hypothetical protein